MMMGDVCSTPFPFCWWEMSPYVTTSEILLQATSENMKTGFFNTSIPQEVTRSEPTLIKCWQILVNLAQISMVALADKWKCSIYVHTVPSLAITMMLGWNGNLCPLHQIPRCRFQGWPSILGINITVLFSLPQCVFVSTIMWMYNVNEPRDLPPNGPITIGDDSSPP